MSESRGFAIRRKPTVRVLAAITLLLIIAHGTVGVLHYGIPLFHLGRERTIPTMFQSQLLLGSALLLASIGRVANRYRASWYGLSLVFLFLAIDEVVGIHERLIEPLREALSASGFFYYTWVIPYVAGLVLLVAIYSPFLFHLPVRTRAGFLTAGGLYVLGAVVFESFSGLVASAGESYEGSFAYRALQGTEETLEMVGLVVFINVLLGYVEQHLGSFEIRLGVRD